jgi:threonylcarbamoyladenosine tRNA methylthiotransferase MtaB
MHGFTDNYIRVEINLPEGISSDMVDNTIVNVRLGEWNEDGTALKGEII